MRAGARTALLGLAFAAAAPLLLTATATPDAARVETRLQLADLLYNDHRYWESMAGYDRAKEGASTDQLVRAASGMLRSLLHVAEFSRAEQEAEFLKGLGLTDPAAQALHADALWAFGLFPEAEQAYEEILARAPDTPAARHGYGRGLAGLGRLEEARVEVQAAIAGEPRSEFFHTLGTIYRRQGRYDPAADAFDEYIARLSLDRQAEKIEWARSEVRFLRSFGNRQPLAIPPEMVDTVHTIPFRLERDKVIVRGRINGSEPLDLVVDTGAEKMVLSQETAQRVGLRAITNTLSAGVGRVGLRGLDLGRVDTFEVENLQVEHVPALIKNPPLSGLPETRSENTFSPLALGLSTVIDYETHQIILARELPPQTAEIELPMRFQRLAMVRGVINGEHEKSFIVDTGGEVISISLSVANRLNMAPVRHIPLRVFGMSGWDDQAFLLPGVNLGFDRIQYDNFSVVVLNLHRPSALLGFSVGGIIGHKFLSNYRVTLDLSNNVLRLSES